MQRKLLALAVASAFAVPGAALAQVTISGSMRLSVDNADWGSGPGVEQQGTGVNKWGVTSHSSNIQFRSREDLGGGTTAFMQLQSGIAPGRANAQNYLFNGRNSGIGLESKTWGVVMMGLWDSPYKSLDGAWLIGTPAAYTYGPAAPIFGNGDSTGTMPNPNCAVTESGAGYVIAATPATVCTYSAGSSTAFQRRLSNTFQWWSPVWNGVQVLVGTQTNDVKASAATGAGGTIAKSDPSLWSLGLRWDQPKWSVVLGYEVHEDFNANAAGTNRLGKDDAWKIGGNYNFGVVQVAAAYETIQYEIGTVAAPTSRDHDNWTLGANFPIGKGAIRAQYSSGDVKGTAVAAGTSQDADMWNLSYEYNLSKRTQVYVAYAKMSQDNASNRNYGGNIQGPNGWQAANGTGRDVRHISFGMNHNF